MGNCSSRGWGVAEQGEGWPAAEAAGQPRSCWLQQPLQAAYAARNAAANKRSGAPCAAWLHIAAWHVRPNITDNNKPGTPEGMPPAKSRTHCTCCPSCPSRLAPSPPAAAAPAHGRPEASNARICTILHAVRHTGTRPRLPSCCGTRREEKARSMGRWRSAFHGVWLLAALAACAAVPRLPIKQLCDIINQPLRRPSTQHAPAWRRPAGRHRTAGEAHPAAALEGPLAGT